MLTVADMSHSLKAVVGDAFTLDPVPLFTGTFKTASAVTFADVARKSAIFRVGETLGLADRFGLSIEALGRTVDTLGLDETLLYIAKAMARQGLNVLDASPSTTVRLLIMAEALGLVTGTHGHLEIYGRLIEALTLDEVADAAFGLTAADTMTLAAALTQAIEARKVAADTLALAAAVRAALVVVTRDTVTLDETQGVTLTAALLAADRLAFVGSLPLGEDDYQMWVLNAENLGVTQYTQVPFNSLVTHEGRSYGINEIGLYELEGEDDAGTDIDAYIRTGMLDFGSATPKRMVRAYMYLRADEEVLLKVVADANGRRSAVWYRLATRETDTLYNRRIKLGRGVEARSWGLEVSNVDGGSLDLRDFRVLPVILRGRPV